MNWILVAIGGTLGALSRYGADRAVISAIGPTQWGIFIINVTGSFLLGLILELTAGRESWTSEFRIFITVGFLGSYTTFSTLTVASVQMMDDGAVARGLLNILGSIAVGLLAAYLGILLGRAV